MDMVVKHSGKKIVCRADCVEVACKMEINILHRNDLSISAACRASLDTENRAKRRLTKSDHYILADTAQTVGKTDCCCCFTFACRCRCNSSNEDELAFLLLGFVKKSIVNLCLISAVLLDIFFVNICCFCDFCNGFHFALLCNLNIS